MNEMNGGFLISQIKQVQGRIFEKMLLDSGIDEFNGAQGRILYVLWQKDDLPIVELSRKTGLAKTTLTSMLDRMETSGHIQRIYDKTDRRQIRIILTDKARALSEKYNSVSNQMCKVFYEGFSEEEIISFEDKLKRILINLTERGK
jgi:DNA-binding MarR family transcriptional regulator